MELLARISTDLRVVLLTVELQPEEAPGARSLGLEPRGHWRRRSPGSLVMTTPSLPRFLTHPLSAMGWWREVTTLMLRLSAKCSTSVVMMATVD